MCRGTQPLAALAAMSRRYCVRHLLYINCFCNLTTRFSAAEGNFVR